VLAEANIILRLLAGKPVFVGFNVTNRCNLRCRFCNVPSLPNPDMSIEQIGVAFDRLEEIGIPVLGVTGGEPFLRADLPEILRAAQDRGMKVTLVTNGHLLDGARMASIAPFHNIVHFALSLDSLDPATYRKLRGGRLHPGEVLADFLRLTREGPRTVYKLNVVVGPHNVDEIDLLLELASSAGLGVSFIPMNIGPGGFHRASDFPGLDDGMRERIARRFEELRQAKIAGAPLWDHRDYYDYAARYMRREQLDECGAGRFFLDLRSDGRLAFCNEMEHFVSLLEVERLTHADLRKALGQWAGRIEQCRQAGACCYTCSYNIKATAANLPAYVWDYLRFRTRFRGAT
jgi:MoaA/NifB/PqqE/SkfB family radical SAM enzyme